MQALVNYRDIEHRSRDNNAGGSELYRPQKLRFFLFMLYQLLEECPGLKDEQIAELRWGKAGNFLTLQNVGYDIFGVNIEYLSRGTQPQPVALNMSSLPFSDEHFSFVMGLSVFHQLKDLSIGLKEVRRVLKANGYFLCTFHSRYALWVLERKLKQHVRPQILKKPENFKYYYVPEILNAFEDNGFKIETAKSVHLFYLLRNYIDIYQQLLLIRGANTDNVFNSLSIFNTTFFYNEFCAAHAYSGIYIMQKSV